MAPHYPWSTQTEELYLQSIDEALQDSANYADSKKNIKSRGWDAVLKVIKVNYMLGW